MRGRAPAGAAGTREPGAVFDVLRERGFIKQTSDDQGLREALRQPLTLYCGYDPTASSLHVGNLVSLMLLAHMQRHGHRPIALIGGGTVLVGDPTGKTASRTYLSQEQVRANMESIRPQLARYVDLSDERGLLLNNADWLTRLNYIEFLRDIGSHFSVNHMLAAESYKARLESGLNFAEFNYMLLQAYDFLHLFRSQRCLLQVGGSDQWANILAGVDLIRRVEAGQAYSLVTELITTASGAKMGKTESGAVWLDPQRVNPYEYYQFWINTEDPDVERFLALFTFLHMDQVRGLGRLRGADLRRAKEVLAFEATRITHGEEGARAAQETSRQLFGGGGGGEAAPEAVVPADRLRQGLSVSELLVLAGLAESRSAARRLIEQGGAYLNNTRLDTDRGIDPRETGGEEFLLRAGKKRYVRMRVAG